MVDDHDHGVEDKVGGVVGEREAAAMAELRRKVEDLEGERKGEGGENTTVRDLSLRAGRERMFIERTTRNQGTLLHPIHTLQSASQSAQHTLLPRLFSGTRPSLWRVSSRRFGGTHRTALSSAHTRLGLRTRGGDGCAALLL